ncbi:nucleocapsid protein [Facey's Paddock virus]|uniref:Nucleoprotein n=1 Tax=Facey's Paddock virus TaxID=159143 RepID=Q8QZ47_9VIRU|nr:nucleocapsid protein [Facey's Paddock virus]AAL78247.1 nucleocapsid protein [Facey's Paddock virus]AHY22348.1 nucleocapsid protein [Facey's Paddock virus]
MTDFVFNDVPQRATSTFDPEAAYVAFENRFRANLTVDVARIFFLNQKKAKDRLAKTARATVDITFGGVVFPVVNNHYPEYQRNPVPDDGLTLHRLSGYLARWLIDQCNASPVRMTEIRTKVIIPLAEVKGCTWNDGASMYLGFAAGAEMFLQSFTFYPLVIEMQRVLKDGMDVNFMRKVLRQRYGTKTAEQWMRDDIVAVKTAFEAINTISWARSGFSPAAREFLRQFGINI